MMFIPTVPLSIRLDGELLLLVRLVIGVHVFLTFIIWFYLYKFWTNSQPEASSHPSETQAKTEESQYSNGLLYTIDEEPWAQEAQQEYEHPQEELELYQKPPPQEQQEHLRQMPQKQQTPPQKQAQQQKKPQPLKVSKRQQALQQQQQEEEAYVQPQPVKPQIIGAPNRGRTSPKRS